jgi:hypothetical protein
MFFTRGISLIQVNSSSIIYLKLCHRFSFLGWTIIHVGVRLNPSHNIIKRIPNKDCTSRVKKRTIFQKQQRNTEVAVTTLLLGGGHDSNSESRKM